MGTSSQTSIFTEPPPRKPTVLLCIFYLTLITHSFCHTALPPKLKVFHKSELSLPMKPMVTPLQSVTAVEESTNDSGIGKGSGTASVAETEALLYTKPL